MSTNNMANLPKVSFGIVGGGGFLGFHIGQELQKLGNRVILIDIRAPDPEWGDCSLPFKNCNILDYKGLLKALEGCEVVIHTVSFGMSGAEQLDLDKTEEVNMSGTSNVVRACAALGVKGLVYTSTVNVVFGGQEIHNGKEDELPYFPLHRHVDHYSRTKSVAEQLVLLADKKNNLRTCALRLQGLMGVGEKRHLPRIVDNLTIFKFTYGKPQSQVQFTSIWNAVDAHVKAAFKLTSDPDRVGGQAFFVTDGEPINNFEYFKPLCEAEIYKTGIHHVFSNEKAIKTLGYQPVRPNDSSEIVKNFQIKKTRGLKDIRLGTNALTTYFVLIAAIAVSIFYLLC